MQVPTPGDGGGLSERRMVVLIVSCDTYYRKADLITRLSVTSLLPDIFIVASVHHAALERRAGYPCACLNMATAVLLVLLFSFSPLPSRVHTVYLNTLVQGPG